MKDATGELSTTVIAIVAIAAILAVFTVFLLPTLRAQIALTQACTIGPGYSITNDDGSTVTCTGKAGDASWNCTYANKDGQSSSKECSK